MSRLTRISKSLFQNVNILIEPKLFYASASLKVKTKPRLIISCKRNACDFYDNQIFGKFSEIPLASKGWQHNKAKGDYFIIHPNLEDYDKPKIPLQEMGIHPKLIEVLKSVEITNATSFQHEAIPVIQTGKHVLLAAETGCGKTLAYLLPIIQNLIGQKVINMNTPKALVLVPNRELAYQIGTVAKVLAEAVDLKVKVIVGGSTKRLMMNPDFADIDILVATPGAIGKLSTVGIYKLNEVAYTVLDEADALIDDSFIERIDSLVKRVSQSQFTLVSATLPKKIPPVLEPIKENLVTIKSTRLHKPLMNITQRFLRLTRSAKTSQLLLIAKQNKDPMLVFTNRNQTCNWLAMFLRENGLTCANINGDMNYNIRIEQWSKFVCGETKILSATDVGSRGLDTTEVRHVVNYDFPLYAADYIHRIGRTGRLGSPEQCKVTNFISGPEEIRLVQQIEVHTFFNLYSL